MNIVLELYGLIAIGATALAITRTIPVHGLLYLVVSLLALACMFDELGAPFAAMLEIIVYAGAIIVLFVFVVMMINLGQPDQLREKGWFAGGAWIGPGVIAALLMGLLVYGTQRSTMAVGTAGTPIGPQQVGLTLYGPYILTVELSSFLLLAGLVSAYHIGRRIGGKS
ncbi:NADH-quinone oxidoreductase subunit J [Swaminathania salitolerans]|uniref:NADH-quinone oxidoreductase subunit J n=1 Tax=Swaminathania salitolerans TaxID=182838 RepID=A0A511BL59_9PROT|nr:NADH-quinone oxidoreductase subunit J [Swaminathania salitolerans]GBQ09409.1 NADH-quinone oxidoreductase chain J [Swaminathania salitolerans LMG 21291]GEL00985.1 NADH:ubiquinone oxidoreductase subunit J [Swaminathania salitolerans]